MMLVLDEADAIAPQKPQKGEERMLGAAEDIVRRGGQRGIGCVRRDAAQRRAEQKRAHASADPVALRTIAPQDLAAMKAWIDVHGTEEQKRTLMDSLPSLPVGDAWFWSPGWPTTTASSSACTCWRSRRSTRGATPKPGEKRREPKRSPTSTSRRSSGRWPRRSRSAKADDPRELRKQIAELKKQLTERGIPPSEKEVPPPKVVEKFVLKDGQLARAEALVEKVLAVLDPSPGRIFKAVVDAGRDLTREELAQLTGYTVNGHFNNMVGSLRSLGVIDYPSRGGVTLGRMFDALS
jgi:hypothetical protein